MYTNRNEFTWNDACVNIYASLKRCSCLSNYYYLPFVEEHSGWCVERSSRTVQSSVHSRWGNEQHHHHDKEVEAYIGIGKMPLFHSTSDCTYVCSAHPDLSKPHYILSPAWDFILQRVKANRDENKEEVCAYCKTDYGTYSSFRWLSFSLYQQKRTSSSFYSSLRLTHCFETNLISFPFLRSFPFSPPSPLTLYMRTQSIHKSSYLH